MARTSDAQLCVSAILRKMRRMSCSTMNSLLLASLASSVVGPPVAEDILSMCPARCKCSLTATPQVLCKELFSPPKYVPQQATSFRCVDCPWTRLRGRDLENYTQMTNISLEGTSHLEFDEQAIEFLGGVQELHLTGYLINPGNLLALVSHGHELVLRNISLYKPPTTPAPLMVSSAAGVSSVGVASSVREGGHLTQESATDGCTKFSGTGEEGEEFVATLSAANTDVGVVPGTEAPEGLNQVSSHWWFLGLLLVPFAGAVCWCKGKKRLVPEFQHVTSVDTLAEAEDVPRPPTTNFC